MLYKKVLYIFILFFSVIFSQNSFCQSTQGFFIKGINKKDVQIPDYKKHTIPVSKSSVFVNISYKDTLGKVSKFLYGNNANPYMTQIVDQPALMNHIKALSPNIIRFPGGNLSNVYFWNLSRDKRPADVPEIILYGDKRVPKPERLWYGINDSPTSLSLTNYYKLLNETNSTGIICVNYSYARYGTSDNPVQKAAHLAADWVRFDKGKTKFWEIGNENYGTWQAGYKIDTSKNKDNQPELISGKLYGEHLKVFADSMRAAAKEINSEIFIGAVVIETAKEKSWEGGITKNWNDGLLKAAGSLIDYYVLHSYYTPYEQNSSPEIILNTAKTETNKMASYMKELAKLYNLPEKPLALTEWNIFATGSKHSCSFINGMHAAIVLGELANLKFGMASRWDLANGYSKGNDHGMFNKGDEPGVPLWNPRPVYYYMYYFQRFFGDELLKASNPTNPDVLTYASKFNNGAVGVVLVNKGNSSQVVELSLSEFKSSKQYYLYTLTGGDDNGSFSQKVFVNGETTKFTAGGPENPSAIKALSASVTGNIKFESAPFSVQYLLIK
ncbi:alpha-L-arabinofuranosidase [Pedobacter jejuensis]|uniref:Alpha-L-arabinofuranosidase n=1 Tax=Pedobacter jejuensis TaxID=1268550 RepID=A0A3N0C2F0_9SPHI|nr:alpha-L-arabinofuranosidase [Pedobacter jejuensis]RNL56639.1 alpha-L-arabinofuranosidase [Pedobacter jejuensis]